MPAPIATSAIGAAADYDRQMAQGPEGGRLWRRRRQSSAPGSLSDKVYPYLVTDEYPDVLSTPAQAQRRIGHGLSVALVSPMGPPSAQVVGAIGAADLKAAGIDLVTAYTHADRNLSLALSNRQITLEFFERGPAGAPAVVISGHWLAATTLVASGLRDRMSTLLGDEIVAAAPHRELLFLFGTETTTAMTDVIDEEFRRAAKPLTAGLFTLGNDGPAPLAGWD
ncbi:hypothetical protein [Mycobacterium branderi]|uniref:Uncharacterized protein n=1 Tax=Mycobacterium branderi TaxID=43348 RepID=A0A7I7WEV6_9MYCO|nr:hypothetical protein [Mycobacterium branderi]MCV7235269.1 hypothetical protein [Mycobacterium branderi]ORA29867.1 hypothetical protein BST20_27840 [Mycobacterium branderi]BBZ15043.1 hypothetical protein MBRA_52380 [Mycobacterium branderi]